MRPDNRVIRKNVEKIASENGDTGSVSMAITTDVVVNEFGEIVKNVPPVQTELKPEYLEALRLSTEMVALLRVYEPDFQMWGIANFQPSRVRFYPYSARSLPYIVKGDFTGDGKIDMVISGHNKTQNLILGIISGATDYKIVSMWRDTYYNQLQSEDSVPPYTPINTICIQESGAKFLSGDMVVKIVGLKYEGITVKQIASFNYKTHTFYHVIGGLELYQWNKDANRFDRIPISDNGSKVFEMKF